MTSQGFIISHYTQFADGLLFTEYSYRYEAVQSVLNNYTKYSEFCFMTATPLDEEFELEELKDIPVVEAV